MVAYYHQVNISWDIKGIIINVKVGMYLQMLKLEGLIYKS